jgi:hypothetical protein
LKTKEAFVLAALLVSLFAGLLTAPVQAQTDPALKTAVVELLKSYLKSGPAQTELGNGSALANWAVLKGVGLPELQQQENLRQGSWEVIWTPLTTVLKGHDFGRLRPLQILTLWEETESEPLRFVRILGRDGLIDPKKPADRKKGLGLRKAVGAVRSEMKPVRSNSRFEKGGWKFTATSSLNPSNRIVRVAIRGSQPCKITGSARSINLNLKGRLFEDLESPSKVKVQVLDQQFKSQGCELMLKDRIDSIVRLTGGGEAKLAGNLDLRLRDDTVTGRFQIDLVSKQAGVALLTGRAVYTLRGRVGATGEISVKLVPVSSSGSRVLRQLLESEGTLSGTISDSVGSGKIELPVLKDPLNWHDAQTEPKKRVKRS